MSLSRTPLAALLLFTATARAQNDEPGIEIKQTSADRVGMTDEYVVTVKADLSLPASHAHAGTFTGITDTPAGVSVQGPSFHSFTAPRRGEPGSIHVSFLLKGERALASRVKMELHFKDDADPPRERKVTATAPIGLGGPSS